MAALRSPPRIPARRQSSRRSERPYGSGTTDKIRAFFADRGLAEYAPPPDVVPRSLAALRLGELARPLGLHGAFHDRVKDVDWDESLVGDSDVPGALATEIGLPAADTAEVLESERFLDEVQVSTQRPSRSASRGCRDSYATSG